MTIETKKKDYTLLLTLAITLLGVLSFAALEEWARVQPKENQLVVELQSSSNLIRHGTDIKQVEAHLKEVAKEIGMEENAVSIGGTQLYGHYVTINVNGYIPANTIGRKLIGQTKHPFKASIPVPIMVNPRNVGYSSSN